MTPELQKKVDQAVKLLQVTAGDDVVEVSYSGGKDSDVILELARMSGIKYRAIYKNTTIDPPGTIKHCIENGVEVMKPKITFLHLVQKKGLPTRAKAECEPAMGVLLDQSKSGLTLNSVVNVPYVQRTATPATPADTTGTNPGNQGNTPNTSSGDDGMS